ncbi:MAG: hypothetical protein ACRDNZ_24160 [Streptosporangiaceae bacterium]
MEKRNRRYLISENGLSASNEPLPAGILKSITRPPDLHNYLIVDRGFQGTIPAAHPCGSSIAAVAGCAKQPSSQQDREAVIYAALDDAEFT